MKTGDVVFVRQKGLFPSLVRFFDKGRFSHVVFFVSDTKMIEADYDIKVRVAEFPYEDYEVISTNPTEEQLSIIDNLTKKYVGETYDFAQILRLFIKLVFGWSGLDKFNTPRYVICSELVGYFLVALGKADKSVINMSPNELYEYLTKNKA